MATQINPRSLTNLQLTAEKRAENIQKMSKTVRAKAEKRWKQIWAEAEKLGVTDKSNRQIGIALDISPSTVRKIKEFVSKS